jgi:large conductance mechanosensitive channel
MLKEFKEFAMKGNVIDLAVGVIIGAAFGKIVSSLVNDMLMPVFGVILGGINLTHLKYTIKPAIGDSAEVAILYGSFIQTIVDFLIIAFSIFLFVKLLSLWKKKEQEASTAPPSPSPEVKLLEEIRDLLKTKQ